MLLVSIPTFRDDGHRDIGYARVSTGEETLDLQAGTPIFHLFGTLAEFARDLIRERTRVGLAAAPARGRLGGRPKTLTDPRYLSRTLDDGGQTDITPMCQRLGVSRATLYGALKGAAPEVAKRGDHT